VNPVGSSDFKIGDDFYLACQIGCYLNYLGPEILREDSWPFVSYFALLPFTTSRKIERGLTEFCGSVKVGWGDEREPFGYVSLWMDVDGECRKGSSKTRFW
jgi:hypothetical protein